MAGRWVAPLLLLGVIGTPRLAAQCPDGSAPPCRAGRVVSAPPPNSVAVLYFDNLSRDTADAYIADGLTEELIAQLSKVERLVVKGRAAVLRYRQGTPDPLAAARNLGVSYLVTGSVQSSPKRLRVAVELVRSATGDRLWGAQYERERTDLVVLQEVIAAQIATGIAGRLAPRERARIETRPTRSALAYDHFLKGNHFLALRTPSAVARAVEEYEAATRLDPHFGRAFARIGYAYALFLDWGWDHPAMSAESLLARGLAAASRAVQQDSTNSDAWMARAYLVSFRDPPAVADVVETFDRAIASDPRNAEAHHQRGWNLWLLGRDDAALEAYYRALALEPDRVITHDHIGRLHMVAGRYNEARRWFDSALAIDPGFAFGYLLRAVTRLRLADVAGARADAEAAVRLHVTQGGEAVLALVELHDGDTLRARERLERQLGSLEDTGPLKSPDVPYLAGTLAAFGDHERALDLLERFPLRGPTAWLTLRWPELDPLRSHSRFQRLVEEAPPPGEPK